MPDRITEEDSVIFCHVFHTARNHRTCGRIVLLLICPAIRIICQIFLRIRVFRYYFIKIGV